MVGYRDTGSGIATEVTDMMTHPHGHCMLLREVGHRDEGPHKGIGCGHQLQPQQLSARHCTYFYSLRIAVIAIVAIVNMSMVTIINVITFLALTIFIVTLTVTATALEQKPKCAVS